MFKKITKCCIMIIMLVACSVTMASPHIEVDKANENFSKNVSDDLIFYVLDSETQLDKQFAVPTVLRYFFTPEGARIELMHINQANAQSDTKTLWFQNDKYQTQDAPKKGESSPEAKQEKAKPKARTL